MTLPALSIHQPWATLCLTRQPCAGYQHGDDSTCRCSSMVKRFETRSRRPPERLIGQRILIHATKQRPVSLYDVGLVASHDKDGAWTLWRQEPGPSSPPIPLPLGAIVGSAVLGEPLPIVDQYRSGSTVADLPEEGRFAAGLWLLGPNTPANGYPTLIEDQRPYGDWSPGRWAWPLHDAAPVQERCPNCWGDGEVGEGLNPYGYPIGCRVCKHLGHRDPIPAKGRQQIGWPCNLEALS